MIHTIQMAFETKGAAILYLGLYNNELKSLFSRIYHEFERERKGIQYLNSFQARVVRFKPRDIPAVVKVGGDSGMREAVAWISKAKTYFFEFRYDEVVCQSEWARKCQFTWLSNIITKANGEQRYIKINGGLNTNVQVVLTMLAMSLTQSGHMWRMLWDMAIDGELT